MKQGMEILDKLHNGFINRPHYTEFVYYWQETFKRGVLTAKSKLPLNSCYKFSFFPRDVYMKKWQFFIFFLFKVKRHVWMTRIKMITNFREVFSRFEENKNAINISSLKNWFKFLWVLLKRQKILKLRFIYTLYNILIIIKQIGTYRGILVNSESTSRLPMKSLLSWCTIWCTSSIFYPFYDCLLANFWFLGRRHPHSVT